MEFRHLEYPRHLHKRDPDAPLGRSSVIAVSAEHAATLLEQGYTIAAPAPDYGDGPAVVMASVTDDHPPIAEPVTVKRGRRAK